MSNDSNWWLRGEFHRYYIIIFLLLFWVYISLFYLNTDQGHISACPEDAWLADNDDAKPTGGEDTWLEEPTTSEGACLADGEDAWLEQLTGGIDTCLGQTGIVYTYVIVMVGITDQFCRSCMLFIIPRVYCDNNH